MEYHLIYLIEADGDVYDLLTKEECDAKDDDFWEEWNMVAWDVNLKALREACKARDISEDGTIDPFSSGSGFDNFMYIV